MFVVNVIEQVVLGQVFEIPRFENEVSGGPQEDGNACKDLIEIRHIGKDIVGQDQIGWPFLAQNLLGIFGVGDLVVEVS